MKKIMLVVFTLVSIMAVSSYVYAQAEPSNDEYIEIGGSQKIPVIDADNIPYTETAMNKLDRGLVNDATFWTEIPAEVAKVAKERDPLTGATAGLVSGTIKSVVRAGTALFDTFTFFMPPYDKPIMKPEFAYQNADAKLRAYLW